MNLCLGFVGFVVGFVIGIGIGATASTTAAGWIGDQFGDPAAFLALAAVGLAALLVASLAMSETKPRPQ